MELFLLNYREVLIIILASVVFIAFFKSMWIVFRHLKDVVSYFEYKIFGKNKTKF